MGAGVSGQAHFIKKGQVGSPVHAGVLCGVSDFDPDDLGMNGCNGFVQFRILGFPHHFNLFPDPGKRLTLGAAITPGSRDLHAACGETASLVGFRDDGVVHDCTGMMGLFTKFLVGMAN
jgi:hypothetical protein